MNVTSGFTSHASGPFPKQAHLFPVVTVVGLLALAVRAAYFFAIVPRVPVFGKYLFLARHVLDNGLGHGDVWTSSPGYSLILAGFLAAGLGAPLALKGIQLATGAMVCALAALVSGRLYRPAAGLATGLLLCFYLPLLLTEGELLTNSWDQLSLAVAVALLAGHRRAERIGLGTSARHLGAAAVLGLCAILRPNALPLIPLAMALAVVHCRPAPLGGRVLLAAGMAVVAAVPIAPVAWHNARVSGEFIPVTASFGSIFYSSNNHAANGLGYAPPAALSELENVLQNRIGPGIPYEHALFTYLAERAVGKPLTANAVPRFWFNEGWAALARNPARAARLMARKLYYF